MKRRTFLKQTAATAVAAGAAPTLLFADSASGGDHPVIGQGKYRYECHHEWGQLPSHIEWQTTHGICIESAGLIYITHQGYGDKSMDTIAVFDPKGKFVRSWGKEYHKGGHGLDIRKEGREEFLYFCDIENRQVVKMTLDGKPVWKLDYPQEPGVYQNKEGYRPTNVAFAPDGGFYVGDGYGSHYIHQYDKNAKWVRTWGGEGDAPGKMRTPHGLWLDNRSGREPSLVVADRANARLQYFTLDGKHQSFVQGVLFPAHFDIRRDVLLVPDLHARVTLLGKDNAPIVHLGDNAEWIAEVKKFQIRNDPKTWVPGRFVHPHDACFDHDGNIFVAEWVQTGRISKLRRVS
jgi:hypothetical protein